MTDSNVKLAAGQLVLRLKKEMDKQDSETNKKKAVADTVRKACAQFDKLGVKIEPEVPDYPSCDYCGEEFAGKLFCSQCRCAYYCSKKCQKKHWKAPNGHKTNCLKMEEICQTKAESFICACHKFEDALADGNSLKKTLIVEFNGLSENGPYKKALDMGLNEKLLQLFTFEHGHIKQRFQCGNYISIVQLIFLTLFYSERNVSGSAGDLNAIDGYRVKQYLRSNDEAFEIWFKASLQVIEIFQTKGLKAARSNDLKTFGKIEKAALDAANGWSSVFTSKKAAKAILLGSSKEADDAAKERAMWIIAQIGSIMNNFTSIVLPETQNVELQITIVTAMIQLRMEEFGIDVGDFLQLLGVKNEKKFVYETVSIPLAESYL